MKCTYNNRANKNDGMKNVNDDCVSSLEIDSDIADMVTTSPTHHLAHVSIFIR